MRARRLLALAGPSGSGKSSLLRAGVGAALRARGQRLVAITPGHAPDGGPVGAARRPTRDTVLLVDQAEEVFTLCQDEDERRDLPRLARRRGRATAPSWSRCAPTGSPTCRACTPRSAGWSNAACTCVGGLDEEGLRATIEKPARQAGLLVEPGLVDLLVARGRTGPGRAAAAVPRAAGDLAAPGGPHADGRRLPRLAAASTGRVAQSAERLYARLDPADRADLRDVMLRLVIPDEEGDPVRSQGAASAARHRPRPGASWSTGWSPPGWSPATKGVLAISHEALARAWPRLRAWLDDDVDGQRILHHLAAAADGWDAPRSPGQRAVPRRPAGPGPGLARPAGHRR